MVFAAVLAFAAAEGEPVAEPEAEAVAPKVIAPLSYALPYAFPTAYSAPLVYNYQPVVQKLVPKEYDVEVKSYQLELKETGCKNSFGNPVPCRSRRSPQDTAAPAKPAETPAAPAAAAPAAAAPAAEKPVEAVPAPVPTARLLPYFYNNAYAGVPLTYAATNVAPLTYAAPAPVVYKAVEPKVVEIEVPTPKFKSVVEKVPVQPLCQNMYGFPVPCA